jgi:peptide/nickel transport system permease protein
MIAFVVRRLLVAIPMLIGITFITFTLVHLAAGSFVPGLGLTPNVTPADIERMRHNLGLDRPLYVQYLSWAIGVLHGDLGRSLIDGGPVLTNILARLPHTLELNGSALLISLLVAVPMGVASATNRGTWIDHLVGTVSVAGISVPSFWFGLIAILVFSVELHSLGLPYLPSFGAVSSFGGDPVDRLTHLILPAVTLSTAYIAIWTRFLRSSMLEVLHQQYVRTARAKGLSETRVIYSHALRNALIPFVTLIGLELPGLIGGSAIVEITFSWPGVGQLALSSALQYDFTTILGITTLVSAMVILANLAVDIAYAALDPRIQHR